MSWVTEYDMTLDNEENVILANQDIRTGGSNVFAYKISPNGDFLWGADGIQLSNTIGFDPAPKAVIADNNDVVFMWAEESPDTTVNSTVFVKRVSSDGTILWETNLSDTIYDFMLPQILHTDNDEFIVSWVTKSNLPDPIPGQPNWLKVFAQKLDAEGDKVWENNVRIDSGQLMTYLSLYTTPYLTSDGAGGAYVMWQSFYSKNPDVGNPTTYVNRFYEDGSLWNPNGKSVSQLLENDHTEASMAYLNEIDELMLSWREYHYDATNLIDCWGVYGQMLDADGSYLWDENGLEIVPLNCTEDTSYAGIHVSKSINNNAVLTYSKNYFNIVGADSNLRASIYAVALNSDGEFEWTTPTVALSLTNSNKYKCVVSNLVDNQWVLVWNDNIKNPEDNTSFGIYAQNLSVYGEIGPLAVNELTSDTDYGIVLSPNPAHDKLSVICKDGTTVKGIVIYSLSGQKIWKGIAQNGDVDVSGLPSGVYMVEVETEETKLRKKLIIR